MIQWFAHFGAVDWLTLAMGMNLVMHAGWLGLWYLHHKYHRGLSEHVNTMFALHSGRMTSHMIMWRAHIENPKHSPGWTITYPPGKTPPD